MKIKLSLLLAVLAQFVALAAPPPQVQPIRANPFTTNAPPASITNTVMLVQSNAPIVVTSVQASITNVWGDPNDINRFRGLIETTNTVNGAINVRSFGAIGNGFFSDDTAAVQSAINHVSSRAGEVFFPTGDYFLPSGVTVTNSCRISGNGARILVAENVPAFTLISFTNGVITGLHFMNTDTVGNPAVAIYGQSDALSKHQIVGNRFSRCKVVVRDLDIFDQITGNMDITVTGNLWDGNYGMTTYVGDVSNCLDIRGFDGVVITDNQFYVTNEERFIHMSVCYNGTITGNIFQSAGSTNSTQAIDIFANSRRFDISGNIFIQTNSTTSATIYGKTTGNFGPTVITSEHTALNVSDNIIDVTTSDVNWQGIALYGPWGQPDQTLDEATAIARGNQIDVRTTSSAPHIELRGFSAANIADNILSGTNTTAGFKRTVSADNNKIVNITGNLITYGRISVNGAASTPQSTNYILSPLSVTIANNQIQSFKNLGGIWITACTNLGDLLISNNRITTAESSSADGLIYMDNCPGSTNVIITGTTGYSDNGNYFVKANTTTVQGEVVTGNFWQSQGIVTSVPPTNSIVTIDFRGEEFQTTYYLNDSTNTTLTFGVTNCLFGRSVIYRLQVGETNRTLAYDPTWVIAQGTPVNVESNRTVVLRFTSWSTNCGSANVTVEPWMQREDVNPLVFNNVTIDRATRANQANVMEFNSDHSYGTLVPIMHAGTNVAGVAWVESTATIGFMDKTLATRNLAVDDSGNTMSRASIITPLHTAASGSGTDVTGTDVTVRGGNSTGTGRGGAVVIQTAESDPSSGSAANLLTTRYYASAKWVTLTESAATPIATISLPQGDVLSIEAHITVTAGDATDRQEYSAKVLLGSVNKSGTITLDPAGAATPFASVNPCSTGTLTAAITQAQSGDAVVIQVNAVSSLTQTFLRCRWQLAVNSSDVATVTPQ